MEQLGQAQRALQPYLTKLREKADFVRESVQAHGHTIVKEDGKPFFMASYPVALGAWLASQLVEDCPLSLMSVLLLPPAIFGAQTTVKSCLAQIAQQQQPARVNKQD